MPVHIVFVCAKIMTKKALIHGVKPFRQAKRFQKILNIFLGKLLKVKYYIKFSLWYTLYDVH